jgi:alkanesulfonate monooxygenase SsuD/methylene tetrahydromethanopterin reductase-like flavin-dependent oxidoreductase (luciferase family)
MVLRNSFPQIDLEEAGLNGFFVGEAVWQSEPWVSLTAAAMCTTRIQLGTMVIEMPRYTP